MMKTYFRLGTTTDSMPTFACPISTATLTKHLPTTILLEEDPGRANRRIQQRDRHRNEGNGEDDDSEDDDGEDDDDEDGDGEDGDDEDGDGPGPPLYASTTKIR